MFGYIGDYERTLDLLDDLRRQMNRAYSAAHRPVRRLGVDGGGYPPTNLYDSGSGLVIEAEVPGMKEGDVAVTLNRDVLTLAGERKVKPPEGYSTHRNERSSVRFSRSYSLPVQVDPDKVKATLKNGVLRVELEKAEAQKPRQIAVEVS
jgi:HSP20 family protein